MNGLPTTDEEIAVARAIRQALETDVGVGNSVNGTGNTFIVGLVGSFDLLKAAKLVLARVDQHRDAKAEADRKAAIAAIKVPPPTWNATDGDLG